MGEIDMTKIIINTQENDYLGHQRQIPILSGQVVAIENKL